MQVKSIAECSKGSILQYFRPSLCYHFHKIFVFEWPCYTGFTVVPIFLYILSYDIHLFEKTYIFCFSKTKDFEALFSFVFHVSLVIICHRDQCVAIAMTYKYQCYTGVTNYRCTNCIKQTLLQTPINYVLFNYLFIPSMETNDICFKIKLNLLKTLFTLCYPSRYSERPLLLIIGAFVNKCSRKLSG